MNLKKIEKRNPLILITILYLVVLFFICFIGINNLSNGKIVYFESLSLSLLPLVGGIFGIITVINKKVLKTYLGSGFFFFSIGLLSWGLATVGWVIYNFAFGVSVPFPSLTDIGYVLSPIFFFLGIIYLSLAVGIKYQMRFFWGKVIAFVIPVLVLSLTFYFVFFKVYGGVISTEGGVIKTLLEIFYPLSDIILLSTSLLFGILSWKNLGGTFRKTFITILVAFIFLYAADISFSYTTINETYNNQIWVDSLYSTSLFLLSFGINSFIFSDKKKSFQGTIADDIFSQLALKIIQEEANIIGSKAWELASEVKGLYVDENRTLRIQGNKNEVINLLIAQYEQVFGQTSRELAKDTIKGLSTVANTLAIDAMVTLNISSAMFFIRQASTGNFQSIFPFEGPKMQIERHHPMIYYLLNHKDLILQSQVPELIQQAHTIAEANDLKEIDLELSKHQANLAGGVYSDQELIGVLLLGPKTTGEFNQQDLTYISRLLSASSSELAQIVHYRDSQAAVLRLEFKQKNQE